MAESYAPDAAKEQELREKIRAGSQELEDYHDLAHLLLSSGRPDEVVPLYRQAPNLSLKNAQRGKVSVELGWTLLDVSGKEAEARTLAEAAISLLADERLAGRCPSRRPSPRGA